MRIAGPASTFGRCSATFPTANLVGAEQTGLDQKAERDGHVGDAINLARTELAALDFEEQSIHPSTTCKIAQQIQVRTAAEPGNSADFPYYPPAK
jgi:hypothetical protein